MKTLFYILLTFLVVPMGLKGAAPTTSDFKIDPSMKAERQTALDRQRRVLWNDDGGGSVGITPGTTREFLNHRLNRLLGTEVNTILFCTKSSGFGVFTHFTKVGELMTHDFNSSRPVSLDPTHLENYVDPLKLAIDFGHAHKMEVFWSMRMNDTHDGGGTDSRAAMFEYNAIKTGHPDWLLGTKDQSPFHGKWTAVDYGRPEIRDLAFRYFQEVCQNYDVDGIELDFFRHPTFFPYPDAHQPVTQTQRDLMTALIERIRTMADAEGKKRGRPILIAMRVPDSVDYCRAVGIDLDRWLSEDLCDMMVPSSYIRMNPWQYSVDLGHKYGVKVYPSLDEPRIRDSHARVNLDSSQAVRVTPEGYRGRALQAWTEGADGVYLYNFFKGGLPNAPEIVMKEIGDPKDLEKLDRTYLASYLGLAHIAGGGYPHESFQKIETLNPNDPKALQTKKEAIAMLTVPDDFSKEGKNVLTLKLRFAPATAAADVATTVNGHTLTGGKADGDWISYTCTPDLFLKGDNHVGVTHPSVTGGKVEWQDLALEVKVGTSLVSKSEP